MNFPQHSMRLAKETRDGLLTGYSHAWCACGDFDMRATSVEVARGILEHQSATAQQRP